jgi:hypothetical protein
VTQISKEVQDERDRCIRVVQAARSGCIGMDLRTLIHFIRDGDELPYNEVTRKYDIGV